MQSHMAINDPYRVGIMAFSDGRKRVHSSLEKIILQHGEVLRKAIASDPMLTPVDGSEIAFSSRLARGIAKELRAADVEAAVFNIPVFAFPNFSVIAARVLDLPVLCSSPQDGSLPGLGGIMAAHGAMRQIGMQSYKLWGDPLQEEELMDTLSAFCRASGAIERMKGSVYGLIGGRSIGMNTGAVSTAEWMAQFGIDVEHIDQLEIIRRAPGIDNEEVERAYTWMSEKLGKVSCQGKAAPEHVKEQVRHYCALREIIEERCLDFAGIKCHYDLSEYYVTQCLSAAFSNDPYDWNGPKDPFVLACEADSDGALTMQILKLLSGYPTLLFDVRCYDRENEVFVCCNCGAQPTWYAGYSEDPGENLAKVELAPVIPKYGGGGAHLPYVCGESEITVARLTRVEGNYRMFMASGEFVDFPREKMAETCAAWPHGYVRMNVDPGDFLNVFNTNHAHVIPGDHRLALQFYCDLMDIPVDCLD
jgi:L-fucose/D-arabinose isomerase